MSPDKPRRSSVASRGSSRARDGLEVLARAPLLLEAEQDRLDGIGREDGGVGALTCYLQVWTTGGNPAVHVSP